MSFITYIADTFISNFPSRRIVLSLFNNTLLLLGFYTDREGQTFCLECGEGEYQPLARQTDCELCGIGQYRGVNNVDRSVSRFLVFILSIENNIN